MASNQERTAICWCGAPLIPTLAFSKAEYYCVDCGRKLGMFDTRSADSTPELQARYESLRAEWDEHAGKKLLTACGWHTDCEKCKPHAEYHSAHATPEEREAHELAIAWLLERAGKETL